MEVLTVDDPRMLFDRVTAENDLDLTEMSLSEYITMVSEGRGSLVALPVFTSRVFRHSFICGNLNKGVRQPKDLEGRRVGVPLYSMTAAVWCRGLLRDDYNVDLSGVTWVEGSMDQPGSHGRAKERAFHKPLRIEPNATSCSLSQLLEAGAIDATIGALMPQGLGTSGQIARIFPNFREVERDYYERTRIHPIMHLIVAKRALIERNPWMYRALLDAFRDAKHLALARMRYTGAPKTMLPFLHAEVEETLQLFGEDPWPDGVDQNRATLNKAVEYMTFDGLIDRAPSLDELFPVFV